MSLINTESQKLLVSRYVGQLEAAEVGHKQKVDGTGDIDVQIAKPSSEEAAQTLELEYMEHNYLSYRQPTFNLAALRFSVQSLPDNLLANDSLPLEFETLLQYLPPALPSTKQLEYRFWGYNSLLEALKSMKCLCSRLEARRIELVHIIENEVNCLLLAATEEMKAQANAGSCYDGLRRINFVSDHTERYMSPIVIAAIVLVAIIHCSMGVARDYSKMQDTRAHIFTSNHIDPIPTTLPTALQYLGLQDELDYYVVCPSCHTLYKEGATLDVPDVCSHVGLDGHLCNSQLFAQQYRGNRTWKKPLRRFSHQPLESWLARFLNRPDTEDMLESICPLRQEVCTDVWGAEYMSTFPGDGEPSFFDCPSDELRLAFLVYHDFFNPFSNMMTGTQTSVGLVMMICLNLPPDVRYDMKNIYVTAMLPGPKEPAMENINKFLRPIVDNLLEHYDPGIYIARTHKHPRGRKVRSAVPISSMDLAASRPWAGLGSHSHTCLCSFCTVTVRQIDDFDLSHFSERSMKDHAQYLELWMNAPNLKARHTTWLKHAVRYTEWLRFSWYNPFKNTTVAPLHWMKDVLEKQITDSMGCSLKEPSGLPLAAPPLRRAITTVELEWGLLALLHLSEKDFQKSNFPEPLLRYLCREKGIYQSKMANARMIADLSQWRRDKGLVKQDGQCINGGSDHLVALAKAEYFLYRAEGKITTGLNATTVSTLQALCSKHKIPWTKDDKKNGLLEELVKRFPKNIKLAEIREPTPESDQGPIIGMERVDAINNDIRRTHVPYWFKKPPMNFSSKERGKLSGEEYKALALVSFPITLVRLRSTVSLQVQEYFDNFLHLSVAVRILSYQSLTEHDISLFGYHYQQYVNKITTLYPFENVSKVQHLGLHIPYFLRKLGPSTRWSESTCEMFIGMLQEITINSRLGQLEQTLHRELIMAANLKATTDKWNFSEVLSPFADIVGDFLSTRYAGTGRASSTTWRTKHKGDAITIDQATHQALSFWARANKFRPFIRHLYTCQDLRRGHVVYQSFTESRNNSLITFRPLGTSVPIPGRIEVILQEHEDSNTALNQPRIVVLAREFKPLSDQDAFKDPYRHHPIVGTRGLNVMGLFYDEVDTENAHILTPGDIVSHIAVCSYEDPVGSIGLPCIVVVDLDLVRKLKDSLA